MSFYVETSAALKLFLDEPGAAEMGALVHTEEQVFTSLVTRVEAGAALGAARRHRRISRGQHADAKEQLASWLAEINEVVLARNIAAVASEVADSFALRGCDAIHLATALAIAGSDLVFVSWDRELAAAALRSGLSTAGIV